MLIVKRRSILIISVLLISVLTAIFCFSALKNNPTGNTSNIKIVLDAGHGGIDGGVSGVNTNVKESELNLLIVKRLEKHLLNSGFSVVLTRKSDAGLYGIATKNLKRKDMIKRKEIIEKANPTLVISIHLNKFSISTRRGAQVFYKSESEEGKNLAESVQNSFNEMDTSIRKYSALAGDYYILNCTKYPSIIAECGFLSNPEEEALLLTEEYQDKIAYAIFKGVVGYLAHQSFLN